MHEMLFNTCTRSFGALGGVTRRDYCNNIRTAVDKMWCCKLCSLRAIERVE